MKLHPHWKRIAVTLMLGLVASASQAHTGHGTSSLLDGLAHPFGPDHLLAMLAVGLWSVLVLPADKVWWGPATFMTSLGTSAVLAATGVMIPFLEHLLALSVVLFGALLVFASLKLPTPTGLLLLVMAGTVQGLAHGAESPATGFAAYAMGFLATTAMFHFGGVFAALGIQRYLPGKKSLVTNTLGFLFGGAGLYFFSQI